MTIVIKALVITIKKVNKRIVIMKIVLKTLLKTMRMTLVVVDYI